MSAWLQVMPADLAAATPDFVAMQIAVPPCCGVSGFVACCRGGAAPHRNYTCTQCITRRIYAHSSLQYTGGSTFCLLPILVCNCPCERADADRADVMGRSNKGQRRVWRR